MLHNTAAKKTNGNGKLSGPSGAQGHSPRDADPMEPSLRRIAERVKRWREEAGLTLKELADDAGVSASTVHKVENGQVSPTVSVLLRIAHGLNRQPSELISLEEDEFRDFLLTRGEERHTVRSSDGSFVEKAARDLGNNQIDLWRATIQPGAVSPQGSRYGEGEIIILCEEGDLTVWLEDEKMTLHPGDSLHCKAWVPRRWENRGRQPVRLTVALTVPRQAPTHDRSGHNIVWRHTVDYQVEEQRFARQADASDSKH